MKKALFYFFILSMFLGVFGMACSDKGDETSEKGMIENMTDKAAEKAAKHLTAPLDKARDAQRLAEDHIDETQKALEE